MERILFFFSNSSPNVPEKLVICGCSRYRQSISPKSRSRTEHNLLIATVSRCDVAALEPQLPPLRTHTHFPRISRQVMCKCFNSISPHPTTRWRTDSVSRCGSSACGRVRFLSFISANPPFSSSIPFQPIAIIFNQSINAEILFHMAASNYFTVFTDGL